MSREIVSILKERGVKNTFSAPYKHTDNSIIERSHRTIFEMAHSMLLYAYLSITFWCEAVAHAVYLFNRLPTLTGEGYMAPITAAFGTEVDLSHENTFGCTCYCINPPEARERGFVDKSNRGIYLGHRANGSPGYIVFHTALNKIVYSSDVTFDESDLHDRSRGGGEDELDTLYIDAVSRHPDDFKWLEGMAYRDGDQLFITTRVIAQQGWVVAYRALFVNDAVGVEETRPIHAADVERLVKMYTSFNDIHLSLGGDAAGLHTISRETDEGGERAGPVVVRPPAGSDGLTSESSGRATDGRPMEAASSRRAGENSPMLPRGRPPATGGQPTPPEAVMKEGQPSAVVSEPPGRMDRQRRQRVPLNVGVLGDVEKVYLFADDSHDFEVQWSDPDLLPSRDTLLYDDIFKQRDTAPWLKAAYDECMSIIMDNDVFVSCELPPGVRALDTKWVLKRKQDADHSWRHKGRLCVKGFLQRWGVNFFDTFAPTAKWISLRIFLTIVACLCLYTRQLDVKTAFLYAVLKEDVYIKVPKGMDGATNPFGLPEEALRRCRGPYLKLKKSLYGLKQAPRDWYLLLRSFMLKQGFTNLTTETCLFVKYSNGSIMVALVFVDDILLACRDTNLLDDMVSKFASEFKIKNSGEVNLYLSINITIDHSSRTALLDQTAYIMAMWTRFGFGENHRVRSPFMENFNILPDEERAAMTESDWEFVKSFPYRELVGSLLFISMCTRGDIAYHVSYLSRFLESPPKSACLAAKRVLIYLFNTKEQKLVLGGVSKPLLSLFCDTDFAKCVVTRKSVECYLLYFGNGCIMWCSKQQSNIALSVAEAEYCCMTPGVNMVRWARNLLYELGMGYARATAVYTDNTTAQSLASNPVHHSRMKQLHLKSLVLRDINKCAVVCCGRVSTSENPADIGT